MYREGTMKNKKILALLLSSSLGLFYADIDAKIKIKGIGKKNDKSKSSKKNDKDQDDAADDVGEAAPSMPEPPINQDAQGTQQSMASATQNNPTNQPASQAVAANNAAEASPVSSTNNAAEASPVSSTNNSAQAASGTGTSDQIQSQNNVSQQVSSQSQVGTSDSSSRSSQPVQPTQPAQVAQNVITAAFQAAAKYVPSSSSLRSPVTFGSVIRLKHKNTGKYLTASNELYSHKGSSKQPAVYCGDDDKTPYALWVVKGYNKGNKARNFTLNQDGDASSMIGWPLKDNKVISLENVGTGRNLHSHNNPSPVTRQQEVSNLGDSELDVRDLGSNWRIVDEDKAGAFEYVVDGFLVKLQHVNTSHRLHSHNKTWKPGMNEVTAFYDKKKKDNDDDNSWWTVEIISQPQNNNLISKEYSDSRQTEIAYWTPLFLDPERDDCWDFGGDHRAWVHAGSIWDPNRDAVPPHDHLEIILGPWGDPRSRSGASFFVIHNADDKNKVGPVQFGDRVKIMAVFGGGEDHAEDQQDSKKERKATKGEADKQGVLAPFRYLWVNEWSRWKAPYRDVVVSRPEHPQTQNDAAVFVFEPILDGQAGPISTNDLVRIKNIGSAAYFWVNDSNRIPMVQDPDIDRTLSHLFDIHDDTRKKLREKLKREHWEILATKKNEDDWGKKHFGNERQTFWEKFRFTVATPKSITNDEARNQLASIKAEIKAILTPDQAQQQQKLADAAQQSQQAFSAAVVAQDLSAIKAMEEALASGKPIDPKDAEYVQALLSQSKAALKSAQDMAEAAAKGITPAALAEIKAQEQIAIQAAQLQDVKDLPIGFAPYPGKVSDIDKLGFGLQDHEVELAIDNKGKKRKEKIFDDFGVLVSDDGSLAQMKQSVTTLGNPWQRFVLQDNKGAEIKATAVGVGFDGTTVVISQDGKSLYGINWADDKAFSMPDESKGFSAWEEKAKKLTGKKRHGKHAKNKRKKKKNNEKPKQKKHAVAEGRGKIHKLPKDDTKKEHKKHNKKKHEKEKKNAHESSSGPATEPAAANAVPANPSADVAKAS